MTAPYRKKQNDEKLDGWRGVRQGGLADQDQTVHAKKKHTHKRTNYILKIVLRIDTKTRIVAVWWPALKRAAASEERQKFFLHTQGRNWLKLPGQEALQDQSSPRWMLRTWNPNLDRWGSFRSTPALHTWHTKNRKYPLVAQTTNCGNKPKKNSEIRLTYKERFQQFSVLIFASTAVLVSSFNQSVLKLLASLAKAWPCWTS